VNLPRCCVVQGTRLGFSGVCHAPPASFRAARLAHDSGQDLVTRSITVSMAHPLDPVLNELLAHHVTVRLDHANLFDFFETELVPPCLTLAVT
jgi:hypothetical protein